MIDPIQYFSDKYRDLEKGFPDSNLGPIRKKGFEAFISRGIPVRHEEWKYTRVSNILRKDFSLALDGVELKPADLDAHRLPGHKEATELIFVNGLFRPELSVIQHREQALVVLPLEEAAGGPYRDLVLQHLGHSAQYHQDGIHALNLAFIHDGLFLLFKKKQVTDKPVHLYYFSDSRSTSVFSQPRTLVYAETGAEAEMVETYITLGAHDSFTNQVTEIVVENDVRFNYYKIQNEGPRANHVGTTHFRQTGKALTNAVTISLDGAMVRNNLNMIMDADHGESHIYGLYLLNGDTHVDNHTIVDNVKPNCFSNELYKGVLDGESTGVFNGKIFVRQDAQKTNAYQSNKNVLLSDAASVNAKPQLEIFADDVKCSHGCTVGQLDEEALFYLRTRGIPEKSAKSLLLHAFAVDILENIKPQALREYVDRLISQRLEYNAE